MSRPDCFVAGFYKCGTTSLYMILQQHKNILVSEEKENYFFRNISLYKKGISWYEQHYYNFTKANVKDRILEVNPGLSEMFGTARRLSRFYPPETPIIFILRNPVDWIYSHFRFEIRRGAAPLKDILYCRNHSFTEAFERFLSSQKMKGLQCQHIFSKQIREYKKYFNNINYIFLEDLNNNPDEVYREILRFLNLQYDDNVDINIKVNVTDFIPRFPLLKKIHLLLKMYNKRLQLESMNFFSEKWYYFTTGIEQRLIKFIEDTRVEDKSAMQKETRAKLEKYFESEKKCIENITGRKLNEIWW